MSRIESALHSLPHSAACDRNRDPILAVLREAFADCREVLEIGSGTGQHAVHFAQSMPFLDWQPTDRGPDLGELATRIRLVGSANLRAPLQLDVVQDAWPRACKVSTGWDAAFSANTLHIMSEAQVERCFEGLGRTLGPQAVLAVYGPFRYGGRFTSESNVAFDAMLRARDSASGIRDVEWIDQLALAQGMLAMADHSLPANNQLRIWHRRLAPAVHRP